MSVRREWFWLALLCLAPALLPEGGRDWLEYRREDILAGELWRLWSGHWVHYSARHALLDSFTLVALAATLNHVGAGRLLPRLTLLALLMSLFMLVAVPEMARYRGASGLVMALAGMLLSLLWRTHSAWRPGLVAITLLLCAKFLADALDLGADLVGLPDGIRVAWQAHAAGLALGLLAEKLSGRVAA